MAAETELKRHIGVDDTYQKTLEEAWGVGAIRR